MSDTPHHVLFVCARNSARSIMAEGILNALGRGRFRASSAGSAPSGIVEPLALEALADMGLPTDGYRSKDWSEFAGAQAPPLDFVFTVCDIAAGEHCPPWPGQPITAHWGTVDPAAVQGSEETRRRAFRTAATVLKRRIELLLSLPVESLDRLSLQQEVRDIGTR